MIKILATDLDGTLLSDDHTVSNANGEALHALMKQGIIVAIATGRAYDSCKFAIRNVDFHKYTNKNYIIAYNGANIIEMQEDKILQSFPLPLNVVDTISRVAKDFSVSTHVYTTNAMYVDHKSSEIERYVSYTGVKLKVATDFLTIKEPITKILLNGEPTLLAEVEGVITGLVSHSTNIFYSQPNYLEFVDKKIDKGIALSYLCNMLGISMNETLAIGDNYNDISLLEYSGVSCCPANAVDAVKAISTYVTKGTNNESAVAEAIYSFIL